MFRSADVHRLVLVSCVAGIVVVALLFFGTMFSTSGLFRRVVMRPIPRSVKDIKADQHHERSRDWREHRYVLRFDISREDASKIIAAGSFTKLGCARYSGGMIEYGMAAQPVWGFRLYGGDEPEEPAWFDLGQWGNADAWIVERESETSWYSARIRLYNEPLRRAYFIDHFQEGSWGGILSVTNPRHGQLSQRDLLIPGQ